MKRAIFLWGNLNKEESTKAEKIAASARQRATANWRAARESFRAFYHEKNLTGGAERAEHKKACYHCSEHIWPKNCNYALPKHGKKQKPSINQRSKRSISRLFYFLFMLLTWFTAKSLCRFVCIVFGVENPLVTITENRKRLPSWLSKFKYFRVLWAHESFGGFPLPSLDEWSSALKLRRRKTSTKGFNKLCSLNMSELWSRAIELMRRLVIN